MLVVESQGIPELPVTIYFRPSLGGRCGVESIGFSQTFLYVSLISSDVQRLGLILVASSGVRFRAVLMCMR